jgi:hypothetical protein
MVRSASSSSDGITTCSTFVVLEMRPGRRIATRGSSPVIAVIRVAYVTGRQNGRRSTRVLTPPTAKPLHLQHVAAPRGRPTAFLR